jgi:hypothetical protein
MAGRRWGAGVVRAAACLLLLAGAGCGHWPWHHRTPPVPSVHELDVSGTDADRFPQRWQRNTLLVDLSAASGSGNIVLKPVAGTTWPVRIALRVSPGAIGVLDVRAAQRVSLPITAVGKPIDLQLDPAIYTPTTPQISVTWGPATGAAP